MIPQILILHTPESEREARYICQKLTIVGFPALVFADFAGIASLQTIDELRYDLIQDSPAIFVLAGQGLFKNDHLIEIARMAKEEKTMIPVLFGPKVDLPAWFASPIDLNAPSGQNTRAWNHLYEILARRLANLFWRLPEPPKPNKPTIH